MSETERGARRRNGRSGDGKGSPSPPPPELLERLPPHDPHAEKAVLGSMLRDNQCINDVVAIPLRPEDFYAYAHQRIFECAVALNDDKSKPVDLVTLADALKQAGHLDDVGGYPYLGDLWDSAPHAATAEQYARMVRDKALGRGLIHAGTEILGEAYAQSMPADQLIEGAEKKILDVAEKGVGGSTSTLAEAIGQTYDRIDKRQTGSQM